MHTFIIMLLCAILEVATGQDGTVGAMLILSGASSPEELSESEVERYESFLAHPLAINSAPASRLLASGLLSRYQTATLLDYRSRSGDILSITELGAVDGFNEEKAGALSHFISLAPGKEKESASHSLLARGGFRKREEEGAFGGVKYEFSNGRTELRWSSRTTYSDKKISPGTLSAAFYSGRGKIIVGDFAARFGQGLLMWSGLSLSGFSSTAAFRKNATGFSPTGSFSEMHRGVAADLIIGRWTIGAACSVPGLRTVMDGKSKSVGVMPVVSAVRTGRNFQFGVSSYLEIHGADSGAGLSADWRIGLGATSFYGEAAIREGGATAVILGFIRAPTYDSRLCLLLRFYPAGFSGTYSGAARSASKVSDEAGASAGWSGKSFSITGDAAYHISTKKQQYKFIGSWNPTIAAGNWMLTPSSRASARFKPGDSLPLRLDLRTEFKASMNQWHGAFRMSVARCRNWAWAAYAEAGRDKKDIAPKCDWTAFMRWSLFRVDSWDDRIYVYERDIPGSFNSPAYYGRGWKLAAVAGLRLSRGKARHQLNMSAGLVRYVPKGTGTASAEIKIQYVLQFRNGFLHLDTPGALDKDHGAGDRLSGKMGGESGRIVKAGDG